LRGQEYPTRELLDFRYRERFHLTQAELEQEPSDVYNINLAIMGVENKLASEARRRAERARRRDRL